MPDIPPTVTSDFGPPDWTSTGSLPDVHCPLCEYNLRGLTEPRCPECGYQFAWADLLDPAQKGHRYLFETYPGSLFAAFWKTAWHGLRPRKFWKTLRADMPVVPLRLVFYGLLTVIICLLGIASSYATNQFFAYQDMIAFNNSLTGWQRLNNQRPFEWLPFDQYALTGILVGGWPVLTFLSLMVFQISMRRAKVKAVHVLRCVIYGWDAVVWVALSALFLNSIVAVEIYAEITSASSQLNILLWALGWGWVATIISFGYRLFISYRFYLRFQHAVLTVFVSQMLVLLTMLIVWLHSIYGLNLYLWLAP